MNARGVGPGYRRRELVIRAGNVVLTGAQIALAREDAQARLVIDETAETFDLGERGAGPRGVEKATLTQGLTCDPTIDASRCPEPAYNLVDVAG